LNLMCTYLTGYYNRNDKVRTYLDDRAAEFPERDEVIQALNTSAELVEGMQLPPESMWWNKANFFSLIAELSRSPKLRKIPPLEAAQKLVKFSNDVPQDYALAAREATGRKGQRDLRGKAIRDALQTSA
jgi:hypothetical protein